jgi:midasin
MRARAEVLSVTKRGNIGLRNLSRSLKMMRQAVNLRYPVIKAIYDALSICFSSHLDANLQHSLVALIYKLFDIKHMPTLDAASRNLTDSSERVYVEEFLLPRQGHPPHDFNESEFILTPSFRSLVRKLASIVAVTDYAVILEGPTSAGKTSTVQYLANVTHNKVIRINNHMHTDI